MNEKEKNDLLYVCTLIEDLGRKTKNRRADIVDYLGKEELFRQLELAEVNHCLSIEQITDEIIAEFNIVEGQFDSVGDSHYKVPSISAIAKNYQRLIVDAMKQDEDIVEVLFKIFKSFISDEISDFNSSVFYSSPEYLVKSYVEGKLLT